MQAELTGFPSTMDTVGRVLTAQVEAGLQSGPGNPAASLGTTQSGCLLLQGKLLLRAAEQLRALGGVHANFPHPRKTLTLTSRPQGGHMVAQRLSSSDPWAVL